jgi:peptide/nickel transport system permease protein
LKTYLLRRLLELLPLLIGITLIVFVVMQRIPGGPLAAYKGNPRIREEDLARLEQQLGLDQPVPVQYLRWLTGFVQGDWGYSYVTQQPVLPMVLERFGKTLLLMGLALLVTLLFAVPLGIISATRQYSLFDYGVTAAAFIGYALPSFWLGLVLILVFALHLRWFPAGGMATLGAPFSLQDRLWHLVLPVFTVAFAATGYYTRYVRSAILEVKNQDYIRTAQAKGLAERIVLYKHAFRNAAVPLVTVVALHVPQIFTGAVVIETIFSWPGMGRLYWESATRFDYPVLMAVVAVSALAVVLANLIADVSYGLLDPRVRYD